MKQRWQLHNKTKQINDIIFGAVAEREPLQDVNAITLKGEYAKRVEQRALDNLMASNIPLTNETVYSEMDRIFAAKSIVVQEAVYYTEDGWSVVVNAEAIDDTAVHRAIELVVDAVDKLDGRYGVIKFGQPMSFNKADLHWLDLH